MTRLIRLTPEIRSDFVAYLDGELDEQAAERIETVLAQSGVARNDIERLAQSYELLDALPRYEATAEFTAQTMESVRLSEQRTKFRQTSWFRAGRDGLIVLLWMVALITVISGAYLLTHRWLPSEADLLVRELPVIERLDIYSEIGSVEFLERLDGQETLKEKMAPETTRSRSGP